MGDGPDNAEEAIPLVEAEETIPLVEERLVVGKRRVPTARVRVRLRTEDETVDARARLLNQDVEIRHVPIGREVQEIPPVRQEDGCTIVPVLEEILVVEKRLVLIEEIHIRQVVSETEVSQPVVLRRQRAEVERTSLDATEKE